MRQHALQLFLQLLQHEWQLRPHQRPRLDLLIDLTILEKSGKFADLDDWMHAFNSVHGVHLVVLYLCFGSLRRPWAVQIWRGKWTPSPAQLALKLLHTVPLRCGHESGVPVYTQTGDSRALSSSKVFWLAASTLCSEFALHASLGMSLPRSDVLAVTPRREG
jgi:hypothetical protein